MKGARAPFLAGCLLVVVFSLSGGLRFAFSGLTDGEGLTKSSLGLFVSRRFVKRIKAKQQQEEKEEDAAKTADVRARPMMVVAGGSHRTPGQRRGRGPGGRRRRTREGCSLYSSGRVVIIFIWPR